MSGSPLALKRKTDAELITRLKQLIGRSNELCADSLAYLAEMDERKSYAASGYSSLFSYCVSVLNLPEDAAYKRIQAARAARKFPLIFKLVAAGVLHLSGICLLAKHLTAENHKELLAAASRKSKRKIEELVAQKFPRPDVQTSLRKKPASTSTPTPTSSASASASTSPSVKSEASFHSATTNVDNTQSSALAGSTMSPSTASKDQERAPTPIAKTNAADGATLATGPCPVVPAALASHTKPVSTNPARIEPLSPQRYCLRVTIDKDAKERLLQAQDLLRHKMPNNDFGAVIDYALAMLVDELEARKFKKLRRQKGKKQTIVVAPAAVGQPRSDNCGVTEEILGSSQREADLPQSQVGNLSARAPLPDEMSPARDIGSDGVAPERVVVAPPTAFDKLPMASKGNDTEEKRGFSSKNNAPVGLKSEVDETSFGSRKASTEESSLFGAKVDVATTRTKSKNFETSRSRHIPNEVRRAVALRDGQRCSYVAPDATRCSATSFLEYHHNIAFARGGEHSADNVSLRCRCHNFHAAVLDFGASFMHTKTSENRGEASKK